MALARLAVVGLAYLFALVQAEAGSVDIRTHHADGERTGWNNQETILDWSNVNASTFTRLHTVKLDEQVDAQPLIVSSASLAKLGLTQFPHDIAIVVTENNTVYEIDGVSGEVLRKRHLGRPVAMSTLPGQCNFNSAVVGINSTPALDLAEGAIYLIAYLDVSSPLFRLHKLKIADLSDAVPSVVISATAALSDGSTVDFNPNSERQRAALLIANNRLYAGFGSFCDQSAATSRGWLMSWSLESLALEHPALMDRQTDAQASATKIGEFFLSAIWMSGYGVAADAEGAIYAVTGNTDANRVDNHGESVIKWPPGISAVSDYFTPANFASLDRTDNDFGSGGAMVVPDQPDGLHFVVAAGKDGRMFLINRDNMGKFVQGGPDVPSNVQIGGCWCGPSYFVGSNGKARIVSSGGQQVQTWLLPSTAGGTLGFEAASPTLKNGGQDPGFHTFVSSNGTKAGSAIVWAVSRPVNNYVFLYAFKGEGLAQLYTAQAGEWVSSSNNANIFPVVANGQVYVASYEHLTIFGLKNGAGDAESDSDVEAFASAPQTVPDPVGGARRFGEVLATSAGGAAATLRLRDGSTLEVDLGHAIARQTSAAIVVGGYLEVEGALDGHGGMTAEIARRAKGPQQWSKDTP